MSRQTDIMAWMQRAYIDARPDPWYRKVVLRLRLFIERHFKKVKGTPGAAVIDSAINQDSARLRETMRKRAEIAQLSRIN